MYPHLELLRLAMVEAERIAELARERYYAEVRSMGIYDSNVVSINAGRKFEQQGGCMRLDRLGQRPRSINAPRYKCDHCGKVTVFERAWMNSSRSRGAPPIQAPAPVRMPVHEVVAARVFCC